MCGVPPLNDVKTSVANLSASELAEFRRWFDEFDAEQWDEEFEQDVGQGKLDALARRASESLRQSECDEL